MNGQSESSLDLRAFFFGGGDPEAEPEGASEPSLSTFSVDFGLDFGLALDFFGAGDPASLDAFAFFFFFFGLSSPSTSIASESPPDE